MTPAERAARMAETARARAEPVGDGPDPDRFQVAREWWLVTTPAGREGRYFMNPAKTKREMQAMFPGSKVVEAT